VRILVSMDLEGMPGISSVAQLAPKRALYEDARRIMTKIASFVGNVLKDLGVDEVVIADAHGYMVNVIYDELPPGITLVSGFPRPLSMVAPIDKYRFDGAIFLGYHNAVGTPYAIFDHTYSGRVFRSVKINGYEVAEYEVNTYILGEFDVPVILVSGDSTLRDRVGRLTPWAVFISFKESLSRYSAVSKPLNKILDELKRGIEESINRLRNGDVKVVKIKKPIELELTFSESSFADLASLVPGAKRISGVTVKYRLSKAIDIWKVLDLTLFASLGLDYINQALR